ncbi:hypothetical protein PILCRDRAFT_826709 [Piloderma croceum F 1598]|uniref:Carboxypeptidase n=1 Tax=Piloderma croceum (strain F 1598) TaxID=765440 RepID=A0A0C3F801_PILCF|nr:hypothetical protein PILCRDRAFT_826709 [Piloderma croceum F 1598]
MKLFLASLIALSAIKVSAADNVTNSWPHNYTGIPPGFYSALWQNYFEVKDPLPNVSFPLDRNFAGSISVNSRQHPNNTLFFWAFEKERGSLTAPADEGCNDSWIIWLQGGPGASSIYSLFFESGPLRMGSDGSIAPNNYSWHKQADIIYLDNPVGVGFSTAESDGGYVANEDQMAENFLMFLENLVLVFPSLAKRPLYLMGESYAGTFIPYIAKALFSSPKPPVHLKKFAIGDGAMNSFAGYEEVAVLSVIETYPQLIDFDKTVLDYFRTQAHICGYDLNLTYPQRGHFPSLIDPRQSFPPDTLFAQDSFSQGKSLRTRTAARTFAKRRDSAALNHTDIGKREEKRKQWKRDLSGRANGTLDPWYACFLLEELLDYATNFTFPWKNGQIDPYDAPDALSPEITLDPSEYMNDPRVRKALHAPTSKNFTFEISYPFNSSNTAAPGTNIWGDPSVEPMAFLSELATNASKFGVDIVFYSGHDDMLVAHESTQVVIQNMTFGHIQGYTRKPSTPWCGDDGTFAGVVHQERNLTYVLFMNAGHMVPHYQPANAYTFIREFVLGSNSTGLVDHNFVVGGEDPKLGGDIIPGTSVIFYGSSTTASSSVAPSSALANWASFLATYTAHPTPTTIV